MRTVVAVFGVALCGLLVVAAPVPKDKEKEKPATDEQREEVRNNFKQIMLAMHNYHDANGVWPADVLDAKTKKPLLSWRVLLLPYMEEDNLYREFKLDEPWDSEHNKKLVAKLPKIYAPTRVRAEEGHTFYRGFGGNGVNAGVFEPGQRLKIFNVTDGTSNTIAVIDAGESVVWTKPGTDLDPAAKEFPKLGRMTDGEFYCGMCDGSVRALKREFDVDALKAAISRSGGEVYTGGAVFVK